MEVIDPYLGTSGNEFVVIDDDDSKLQYNEVRITFGEYITYEGSDIFESCKMRNCKVQNVKSGISYDATCQYFVNYADADKHITMLGSIDGKYIVKPKLTVEDKMGRGLAIVERLKTFQSWLAEHAKKLWRENEAGRLLGFSKTSLKVIEQVLFGLKTLHEHKLRHGNVSGGVFFGLDGKVRLGNFKWQSMNTFAPIDVLSDLKGVEDLVKLIMREYPPPNPPRAIKPLQQELTLFFGFFEFDEYAIFHGESYSKSSVRCVARFLYRIPMLWKEPFVGWLIDAVNDFDKAHLQETHLKKMNWKLFSGWHTKITRQKLKKVFNRKVSYYYKKSEGKVGLKVRKRNERFSTSWGANVFFRHCKNHARKFTILAIREAMLQFPHLALALYHEILRSKIFILNLNSGHLNSPHLPATPVWKFFAKSLMLND